MRQTAAALLLLPALAMAGPASAGEALALPGAGPGTPGQGQARLSDTPAQKVSGAKVSRSTSPVARSGAIATAPMPATQAQAAPLDPRWVAPRTRIKGLVVWIYTPGHFQRD